VGTKAPPREASRDRVLAFLRARSESAGVATIAAATGLSSNAVRFHLEHLIEDGAVRSAKDEAHTGPGRPSILYRAAPAEAVESAAAYRLLAGLLAAELGAIGPADASTEVGRTWARRLARPRTSRDPVQEVLRLFEDTGFEPQLRADGRTVELHRCPFYELAAGQPDVVCDVHLGLVTGVLEQLGAPRPVQLTPVLDGSGPCLLRIGRPLSTPAGTNTRPRSARSGSREH
jgi:predicted ArsR family transcriptional regulator